jgi:hypothetical protein
VGEGGVVWGVGEVGLSLCVLFLLCLSAPEKRRFIRSIDSR